MSGLGRGLQLLGLVLPPSAIVLELLHAVSLGQMLMILVAGISVFWIGRIVEGYSRP
jgi:hypothetical protein